MREVATALFKVRRFLALVAVVLVRLEQTRFPVLLLVLVALVLVLQSRGLR